MKPTPTIPPAEAFDFPAIPLAEIKEATLWEYARTVPTVSAAAVRWLDAEVQGKTIRAHLQAAARKPYTGTRSLLYRILDRDQPLALRLMDYSTHHLPGQRQLAALLWDRLDFPCHWTKARCATAHGAEAGPLDVEPLPHILSRWDHIGDLKEAYQGDFALHIRWHGTTQKQIVADFARWVAQEAKRHPEMKPRGKAGQIPTDPLKWLAAYRLDAAGLTYPQTMAMLDLYENPADKVKQRLARLAGIDPAAVPTAPKMPVHNPDALPRFADPSGFSDALSQARTQIKHLEAHGSLSKVGF